VRRYADDLVVLHPDREVLEQAQALSAEPLRGMGLAWTPSTTRMTPPWPVDAGVAGFDCLGCNMRQDPTKVKRGDKTIIKPSRTAIEPHKRQIVEVVRRPRAARQARLIEALTPIIRGGRHDFATVCSTETFEDMAARVRPQLRAWRRVRHPHTPRNWGDRQSWRQEGARVDCAPRSGGKRRACHTERPIRRHVTVQGRRRPDDGDEG
jgi:RNA-directed DNA polymerase